MSNKTGALFAFYGFGNYLTGGGKLGSKMAFILATDKRMAVQRLLEAVASGGEVVEGSLHIASGNTIRPDWLLAAAMEAEADWSSGVRVRSTTMLVPEKLLS